MNMFVWRRRSLRPALASMIRRRAVPGVVAHEEKIYAFDGRNPYDDKIIRGGLHSRSGIFSVFPVLTSWSWT